MSMTLNLRQERLSPERQLEKSQRLIDPIDSFGQHAVTKSLQQLVEEGRDKQQHRSVDVLGPTSAYLILFWLVCCGSVGGLVWNLDTHEED